MSEDAADDTGQTDLPTRRWVTMEAEHDSPQVGGYEMTTTCVCGTTLTRSSFSAYDTLSCEGCGRRFKARFEQIEGATRKHPVCPDCHVGMTHGSGYWCPECDISLNSSFIDDYDDVLREYQLQRWLADLKDACSMSGTDWHLHGHPAQAGTIAHCRVCCPECDDCDCGDTRTLSCDHGNDGETVQNLARDANRAELYRRLRHTLDTSGRFDCDAERRAEQMENDGVFDMEVDEVFADQFADDGPIDPDDEETSE